jgi:hypothetical protein
MSEQYDPSISYDLIYSEGQKVGEVRQGRYFERGWEVGFIDGDIFHYNGQPAGVVKDLIITRNDQPGLLTLFRLVPKPTR